MPTHADIPVVCSLCATRMHAVAEQIGKGLKCPDCHTVNVVKAPVKKRKPQPTLASVGDDYQLKVDPTEVVEFTCTSCHDAIKTKGEYAGRKVRCPNCDTVNIVPRSKEAQPAGDSMQFADGVVANPTKKQIADRIMARAREESAKKIEEFDQPEIPIKPFLDGVYNFPFYGNVLVMWVGWAGCMAAMGWLLSSATTLLMEQSYGMGTGLFLGLGFGVVFAFTIFVYPPKLFRITESTATGYDKVDFTSNDFFDRLLVLFLLFNAIGFASMPGIAVAAAVGVPKGLGFITVPIFFPVFLLSMLETTNPWKFFSDRIRNSFGLAPASWVTFYCLTVPVVSGVLILFITMILNEEISAAIAVAAIPFPLTAVIYFRMLGRLALLIGQAEIEQGVDGLEANG